MNKKLVFGLVATFGATIFASTQVSAAETAQTSKNMTTDGSITFYKDNKPNPGPFQKNLSLAYVPGEFNFGTNKVTNVTGTKVYNQVSTGTQYVAVSDDREKKDGWTLSAGLDDFTNGTKTLEDAELSLVLNEAQQYHINAAESDAAQNPVPAITDVDALSPLASSTDLTGSVSIKKPIKLVAGGAVAPLMSYSYADGKTPEADGVTAGIASEVTGVQLTVKDHSTITEDAKYTSTVNWTLSATPTDVQ